MLDLPRDEISLSLGVSDKLVPSAGLRIVNSIPHQRFRKNIARVGDFRQEGNDLDFSVTPAHLSHWAKTFVEMKANGVKLSIPNTHKGHGDPLASHGDIEDVFVSGDFLAMSCDIIGQASIEAVQKGDVSIRIDRSFTDGSGNKYDFPITHVALVTDPTITGLGDFIPLAASLTRRNKVKWDDIQKDLGIAVALTDDNAREKIAAAFKSSTSHLPEIAKTLSLSQGVTSENVVKLMTEAIKAKVLAASVPGEKPKPDAMLLSLTRDNRKMKLDAVVGAARLTPAMRDKILDKCTSDESMTLSMQAGVIEDFDFWMGILAGNDPVELKEKSGPQTKLELSNSQTDKGNSLADEMKSRHKKTA